MDFRKLSARPRHHRQAEGGDRAFYKSLPCVLDRIAREQGIEPERLEVWFCDEARVGQKTQLTRRWARRGTRPVAVLESVQDQFER